jgi:hypothetical protein
MKNDMVGRRLAAQTKELDHGLAERILMRTDGNICLGIAGLVVLMLLAGCNMNGPAPATNYEVRMKEDFTRDRDNCRQVAEQTTPYVDPKNGKAVGERSFRVEGEIQKCMLARGWNNPRFDGWKAGRY